MSIAQRIIVRYGLAADIPSLHIGELGMDTDTITLRLGNDTHAPAKIMTTQSSGVFDYSTIEKIILPNIEFAEGAGFAGLNFESLKKEQGIVISLGDGEYRQTSLESSDKSVIITNGLGQSGKIDVRVSGASITNALGGIRQELMLIGERIDDIDESMSDDDDTLLKLIQLTGRPAKTTELGTFSGDLIPDNATIKTALQALETALENVGAANYNLEISVHDDTKIAIKLKDGNFVVLEGATPDLAGLMVADDKLKMDFITVVAPVDLNQIAVVEVKTEKSKVTIKNSNETEIDFPIATTDNAGAILSTDKDKLNNLTVKEPQDIDQIENRVTAIETFNASAGYFTKTDVMRFRAIDGQSSFRVSLTDARAFGVFFDRTVEGFEFSSYDAILADGVEVVPAENVTKSYRGVVVFYKSRNGNWYFVDQTNIAHEIDPVEVGGSLTIGITAGNTNAYEIWDLELV